MLRLRSSRLNPTQFCTTEKFSANFLIPITRRCFTTSLFQAHELPITKPTNGPNPTNTTHFGFQEIKEEEKESKVREVFCKVADSYDQMNDVLSMGLHRLWKDHFVRQLIPPPPSWPMPGIDASSRASEPFRILDMAGGTGKRLLIIGHLKS